MVWIYKGIGLLFISCVLLSCEDIQKSIGQKPSGSNAVVHPNEEVEDLLRISITLDRKIQKILPERNLRPAAEQRQFVGVRKKIILCDDSDTKWLFKSSGGMPEEKEKIIQSTTDLLTLCGIKVPRAYAYEFSGDKGTVEIYIKNSINLIDYDLSELTRNHLEYLSNHQVIDWLVSDLDRHRGDFILSEMTRDLYGLDMDGSFDEIGTTTLTDNTTEWIYNSIWEEYQSGRSTPSFRSPQGLVGFVESLDDSVILELFEDVEKPSCELDSETIIQSILKKKRHLRRDFEEYYESLAETVDRLDDYHEAWSDEKLKESTEAYRWHAVELLKEKIANQRRFLAGESVDFL